MLERLFQSASSVALPLQAESCAVMLLDAAREELWSLVQPADGVSSLDEVRVKLSEQPVERAASLAGQCESLPIRQMTRNTMAGLIGG